MKMRKHRKLVQCKVRHGNAFNWRFEKFVRRVIEAFKPLNKAFEEAYAKSRNEQQTDSQGA
jgi:hypothetical protein